MQFIKMCSFLFVSYSFCKKTIFLKNSILSLDHLYNLNKLGFFLNVIL